MSQINRLIIISNKPEEILKRCHCLNLITSNNFTCHEGFVITGNESVGVVSQLFLQNSFNRFYRFQWLTCLGHRQRFKDGLAGGFQIIVLLDNHNTLQLQLMNWWSDSFLHMLFCDWAEILLPLKAATTTNLTFIPNSRYDVLFSKCTSRINTHTLWTPQFLSHQSTIFFQYCLNI